mgnify:CR=1 FL=1
MLVPLGEVGDATGDDEEEDAEEEREGQVRPLAHRVQAAATYKVGHPQFEKAGVSNLCDAK